MSRNLIIACSFLGVLIIWMLTGLFSCKPKEQQEVDVIENALFTVRVKEVDSELIKQEIVLNGKTEPGRRVTLRSEIDSKVISIGAKRGDFVQEGEMIVTLDEKDLRFRLEEAEALLQQRSLEYKAAQNLFEKKMHSEMKVAEAKSALEHANAVVAKTALDLKNTEITAPFAAMLQARFVQIGGYVQPGQSIADLVETDPLTVTASVSERYIHTLYKGMPGIVKLSSGQQAEGIVDYISPESDLKCRTFTVEIDIPNPDHKIAAGETVQMILFSEPIEASKVPLSALVLDDEGVLGVKMIDQQDIVHFVPAKILKSTNTETWITGLPEKARIITVGQHYVRANEHVAVDEETPYSEIIE